MRDSIDFKNMDIAALFRKLLLPTVLGMIFSALFVITDGIFVGKRYRQRCPCRRQYRGTAMVVLHRHRPDVRRRSICGGFHPLVTQ